MTITPTPKPDFRGDEMFRVVVETAPVAMAVIREGKCILANPAFGELRGCAGKACGRHCDTTEFVLFQPGRDWQTLTARLRSEREVHKHLKVKTTAGHAEEAEVIFRNFQADGEQLVLLTIREAREDARMRRLVNHLAFHDSLTELPNRALFFDRLSQALARARREDWGFALLILDLDGFKEVNDTHGHGMGDELLHSAGRRLLECVRESDTVARLGGDEFGLLLHGVRSEGEASQVALKVLRHLAWPFDLGDVSIGLGASIGIVLCPDHGLSLDTLLTQADRAMYQAKQEGKCCHVFADSRRDEQLVPVRMPWVGNIHLGHETMDAQHFGLAEAINALIEGMANGREHSVLNERLAQFEGLVREHFDHEEALMEKSQAPNSDQHKASHRRMLAELPELAGQVRGGAFTTTVQALRKWLLDHLRGEDRELAGHLRAQAQN